MAEEPEVKVVEFEDAALFEIDGKRYELALEDSHLVHEIDARLAKIPASRYDMKDFTITVPYLFEVPGLHKYLDVDLSIACQPWDNQPDSYYVSTNLGIEQAHLRDKRENERVEEEKVVIDDDFERVEGRGDSYAIKQNDNWVVYGAYDVIDDPDAADHDSITYKIKNLDNFSELAGDVPVYVSSSSLDFSQGTNIFDKDHMVSARDMDQRQLKSVFITKDQVLKDAAKMLEKNGFALNQHNQEWLAKKMIERAGASHYGIESDIEYTNNEISDQLKYNVVDKFYTQLDGFYNDPQIEKVKNQKLVEDSNADMGVLFEGETINDFITAQHVYTEARSLDYKQLNKELERAGLERLDQKRLTPKLEAVIDGHHQVLSEHEVISWAQNTLQQKYESDHAMETAVGYLRNPNLYSPKKRLKLAANVLANVKGVQLYKIGKERPITAPKPIFKKKAKER